MSRDWEDSYMNSIWKKDVQPTQVFFKPYSVDLVQNPYETPKPEHYIRIVCMSDTHGQHNKFQVPPGDIFIHAGDFTKNGDESQVQSFTSFLAQLPHTYKVVIAGNHELTFEHSDMYKHYITSLPNTFYLQDSSVHLYGIYIYGSPWQPAFCNWAFNLNRGEELRAKWDLIPTDTDILITHGPPLGRGDFAYGARKGCADLLYSIQHRIHPRVHVFGHIHEGYGASCDGVTTFINASNLDGSYYPKNPPIVFDYKI